MTLLPNLLLPLLLIAISAAILIRLLLSLRVSTVTTCRGCGENLWGRPKLPICPTCGGDRRVPRSKRGADGGRGRIRRRRRAVALLTLIALVCGVWLGGVIAFIAAGPRLNPYKPTWLLIDEAVRTQQAMDDLRQGSLDPGAENAAMTELDKRIGTMSRADLQLLINRALAFQQDDIAAGQLPPNARGQWYWLVEYAHGLGRVSAADWARYLSQGADGSLTLTLRSQVTRGDPLVMAIHCNPDFAGGLQVSYESDLVPTIAGRKVAAPEPPAASIGRSLNQPDQTVVDLPPDLLSSLSDGPQTADVTAVVNVRDGNRPNGPPIYSKSITLHGVWLLVPVSSPSLTVDTTIEQHALDIMTSETQALFSGGGASLLVQGNYANYASLTTSRFAYRVYLRGGGHEWEVGRGVVSGNLNVNLQTFAYGSAGRQAAPGAFPPKVDVIIRPSDEDAVRTIDCTKTWRGEIVVPNVQVQ